MPRAPGLLCLAALSSIWLGACGGARPGHGAGSPGHGAGSPGPALHVRASVGLPLAPATGGCGGATRIRPAAERIPATIGRRAGQVAVSVRVCVDGRGPFPFLVDTGASGSAVDTALARKLGLPAAGPPRVIRGVGCSTHARQRSVRSWSVAGFPLAPQTMTSFTGPGLGAPGMPVGLLGSDVWERFGQLRIDYRRRDLIVPRRERPVPARRTLRAGVTTAPLPRSLVPVRAAIESSLVAAELPRGAALVVGIAFGHSPPLPFLVDTGSTTSLVQAGAATQAGLRALDQADTQATICSRIVTRRVLSGTWFIAAAKPTTGVLARHALRPQVLDEASLGQRAGGLFGSDEMSRFGSVVFDYAGGRIFLGAG